VARHHEEPVGIAGVGWYLPEGRITAEELAAAAGVDVEVVTDHVGIRTKRRAGAHEHPADMATWAAERALVAAGVTSADVDLVIFAGEGPVDWNGWSPAASVQQRLGVPRGFAFDLHNACCGANVAMTVAAGLMHRDPDVTTALVVTAVRFSDRVDLTDPATHGLWTLSDGATAAVLRRDEPTNRLVGYAERTEPGLADLVRIPLGGTREPFGPGSDPADALYRVTDAAALDDVLNRVYVDRYVESVEAALARSGLTPADIGWLFTNQLKVALMDEIHDRLGVPRHRTVRSLSHAGHIGPGDTLLNLGQALAADLVRPGDVVVLATSGLGFSWAASVLQH
jgi:3-oxoacyl-[acyl-carrier-protein] synthase-3